MPPAAPTKVATKPRSETSNGEASPSGPLWSSPAKVSDAQGLSAMFFSFPGVGKTTMLLSLPLPLLIINFDEEVRSIRDLGDDSGVSVWPGERQHGKIDNWLKVESFLGQLLRRLDTVPFQSYAFDTLNSAYDKLALPYIRSQNSGNADPRATFGKANDLVLEMIRTWSAIAREKGKNVAFTCHAEEKQVGENGPIYIRPKITPGVVTGMYQAVSLIGYLAPGVGSGPRTLQLQPTSRIVTKIHQPRTGRQLPAKITDPDLTKLVDHLKGIRPYPVQEKKPNG